MLTCGQNLKVISYLKKRIAKSFLDLMILSELRNGALSSYDVMLRLHKKHGLFLSPGTLYSTMYSLERKDLVESVLSQRKRTYLITRKGKITVETILDEQLMTELITELLKT